MSSQVFVNYSATINQSSIVDFFRSTPRWPSASKDFDFSFDYLTPVALTALIPVIFASCLILLLLIHLVVRFTCRKDKVDDRLHRHYKSRKATYFLVPISCVLLTSIFILTSVGLIGNISLHNSAYDGIDVFSALLYDISRAGFAVVDTAIYINQRLVAFDPSDTNGTEVLSETVGDLASNALNASKVFMLDRYPDVVPLRENLAILTNNILDVFDTLRRAVDIAYAVLLVIIFMLVTAPPLLRIATASAVPRFCSVVSYSLFLFVPALLAWALVGVMSSAGAVVADVCVSLHDYRDTLRGVASAGNSNAFIASGFTCPSGLSAEELRTQIDDTTSSILQSDLARSTVERLLATPARAVAEAADWTADQLPPYLDCSKQVQFAGQLEFIACGDHRHSTMVAIYALFVAFIGLALALSLSLFASLMGLRVMRALDVWPAPPVPVGAGAEAKRTASAEVENGGPGDDLDRTTEDAEN